jgi:hypothetical protein
MSAGGAPVGAPPAGCGSPEKAASLCFTSGAMRALYPARMKVQLGGLH